VVQTTSIKKHLITVQINLTQITNALIKQIRITKMIDTDDMSQEELDTWSDINNDNNDANMDDWADAHNPNNDSYIGD